MRDVPVPIHKWLFVGAAITALLFLDNQADARGAGSRRSGATLQTIDVTAARPVARAMDAIEKRYGVLIDYVDPRYAAPQDMQIVRLFDGRRVKRPYAIPRVQTISLRYAQVANCPKRIPYISCNFATIGRAPITAWPQGGITALIQRVLGKFASEGGQIFLVQKIQMSYGPRWEVYPEEARDHSGRFVYQPDILGTSVFVPAPPRVPVGTVVGGKTYERVYVAGAVNRLLHSIYQQLEQVWGDKFRVAGESANASSQPPDGRTGQFMSAWKALATYTGPGRVLRLLYAPDEGIYYPNFVNLPHRLSPRPPNPPAPKPVMLRPRSLSPLDWLGMVRTPRGTEYIQAALAKAGYLRTQPATRWGAGVSDAIRRFQVAHGLPGTGKLDGLTIVRLEPYLPKFQPPQQPRPNPLGPRLFYWLESTRRGQNDIQRALAEKGFYSGPTTGDTMDAKTRAALRAFQKANGLRPTGLFDGPTSARLAPLLLKMKN